MRFLLILIRNLVASLWTVLAFSWRLPRWVRRPQFVRFKFKNDVAYRAEGFRRWPFRRAADPSVVTSLKNFTDACDAIIQDKTVEGLVIEIEEFEALAAKRDALVETIERVKKAGKKVVGFAVTCDTPGYELLCAADQIWMPPAGRLELTGYSVSAFTIGNFLKRLGVNAQFVRRGEHKTAPEMFTHDEVSVVQRQTLQAFLDERYQRLLDKMSSGRRLSATEAKLKLDAGPYSARRAFREGLIDRLVTPLELDKEVMGIENEKIGTFRTWQKSRLIPPKRFVSLRRKPSLSVVSIQGMIAQGTGGGSPIGPKVAGVDHVIQDLKEAGEDSQTQGILLHIDSPGGSAIASELILEEVRRTAKDKPIVAFFDRVAASGGYMAALGAKELWCAPQAVVGSIGVFAGKFDVSSILSKLGVSTLILSRGENAGIYSMVRPFTELERHSLEAEIEETYQTFLKMVAHSRGMTKEEVHELGEGRVYSGARALQAKLVDRLGSFEQAAARTLALANVSATDWNMRFHTQRHFSMPWLSFLQKAQHERVFALWSPWWSLEHAKI